MLPYKLCKYYTNMLLTNIMETELLKINHGFI